MFFPEGQLQVHLFGHPADMRKSYDGLYGLVRKHPEWNPLSGHLFVFVNRSATQMKVLYWDRTGYCIWGKRLESGRFVADWSLVQTRSMDYTTFKLLLEGLKVQQTSRRYNHDEAIKKLHKNMALR